MIQWSFCVCGSTAYLLHLLGECFGDGREPLLPRPAGIQQIPALLSIPGNCHSVIDVPDNVLPNLFCNELYFLDGGMSHSR